MTLAVGPNHIVAWVNSQYAVFNKAGTVLLPPVNGNALFAGLGNVCETTNRGDPILQYDRLAQRWILSQFAFGVSNGAPVAPYLQCFAVSTTADPTGTYFRYSVAFGSVSPEGFNDYGKLGVWPDGYYTAYNIFGGSPAGGNTGVSLCVSDRTKMLAGDPTATTLCAPTGFYGGGASFLPADVDGTAQPSDVSQGGIFMRVSTAPALRMLKLKPNFAAGTVTITDGFGGATGSFVNLPLPGTTNACNGTGGTCVAQPGTTTVLDTLGTRLMYRLAFRNRGGVESLVVTHSVDPDGAGGRNAALRWYEVRNPLGNPADAVVANRPVIFQNGTYNPGGTADRWMGSIAMDGDGNMLMGYSIVDTSTSLKPSIAVAGRQAGDALNTLQAEVIALTGTGSQTGTLTRWGDYSTIQTDPVDDKTFWFIGQYLSADGSFNWRTRIVSYRFPDPATLSINNVSQAEGNSSTSNAVYTITRSNNNDAVSVRVDTANGTAIAGSDYVALSNQIVNFTAGGALTATVNVVINGDTVLEPNETYSVILSAPTNASISAGTGAGVIVNDDSASIAIGDRMLAEGNSGNTAFQFAVTLNNAVQGGFTVPFATINGTATQPSDYANTSGTLTFAGAAGEIQTVTVQVVGDAVLEPNETFTVTLGSPSNAAVTVADNSGLGTIVNDDSSALSISDRTLAEGNSGNTAFQFVVTLNNAVQGGFTVPFSSAGGTASPPSDYASVSGNATFTGTAGETQTVTVQVVGDTVVEANETFTVSLGTPSNAAVTLSDGSGFGQINNDDAATVAINSVTQAEGNSGFSDMVFTATLNGSVQGGFAMAFATANDTAVAVQDYTARNGILTFTGSANEQLTITVPIVGDLVPEPDERFFVDLGTSTVVGITPSPARGNGVITNDDLFADVSVTINDGRTGLSPGQGTVYTVTVRNNSTLINVPAVLIVQTATAGLQNFSWTCSGSGGATCPASASGVINQTLAMPQGSTLTFLVSANVTANAPIGSTVSSTVTTTVAAPYSDPTGGNNSATDSNTVEPDQLFTNGFES